MIFENQRLNGDFWKNKRVFITGHTGFKGTWLCHVLVNMDARVYGYSLPEPPSSPDLFSLSGIKHQIVSWSGDIRDRAALAAAFKKTDPDIVVHMAAQAIVNEGYADPATTFDTNVMGTVNLFEAVRKSDGVRSFLNITTDKVYRNVAASGAFKETDTLGGRDPYSCSKSCSELVTDSYRFSFFNNKELGISTARAGNVIGGGDFAKDRIIPDCVRAVFAGAPIKIRNPYSIRPYQHVLEPIFAYLMILQRQTEDPSLGDQYNIGPAADECLTTKDLVSLFCRHWGEGASWFAEPSANEALESPVLQLNCSKIHNALGWTAKWSTSRAVAETVKWSKAFAGRDDVSTVMNHQIEEYLTGK